MHRFIWLVCFVLFASVLQGQEIKVSDKISIRDDYAFYLLGKQNDQYLLLRDRESHFIVQAYNSNLAKVWDKKLNLDGRRTEIIDAFGNDTSFCVLYQYRKRSSTYLKVHRYNASANLIDSVLLKNYGVRFNTPFPLVQYSPNRQKILIYHVDGRKVETMVMDVRSLKIEMEHIFEMDNVLSKKYLFQPIITDQGQIFLAYEINNRKSSQKKHQFVVESKGRNQSATRLTMPAPDFITVDYFFAHDPIHQKLIGVGLYANKNVNHANGLFTFDLTYNGQTANDIRTIPFEPKLVASLAGKLNKRSLKGVEDMRVENVIVRSDGGVVVLMEKVKIFHRSSIEMPGMYRRTDISRVSTDFFYEDVFVMSINQAGKLDWKNIFYKEQTSQNDQGIFSSYFLFQNDNALRLIFNDDIRRHTNVVEYKVTPNGQSKRSSLFNTGDADIQIRMKDGLQIRPNEAIFPSQYKKKLKLVVIRY